MLGAMAQGVHLLILLATAAGLSCLTGTRNGSVGLRAVPHPLPASNNAPVADGPLVLMIAEQDWQSDDPVPNWNPAFSPHSSRGPTIHYIDS